MASKGVDEWNSHREVYSPSEVEAVLRAVGIDIVDETDNDWLSLCPYHGNSDRESPAFSTSKRYGYSICFNPACGVGSEYRLTLEKLVSQLKHIDRIPAKRFINQHKSAVDGSFRDKFDSINIDDIELNEFPAGAIDKMHERLMQEAYPAQQYLKGRGFTRETIEHFKVGFTPATTDYNAPVYRPYDMIVVPAYDHRSRPVGLIGRSVEGKEFKNYGPDEGGKGFHKSQIVWNLNNARKHETIILTEATFDAMRVHQAGYPNVGALLGGSLSQTQEQLLNRHFNNIVIMTDNESGDDVIYHRHCLKCLKAGNDMCQGHKPGRELGMKIAERLPRMRISWAVYDDRSIYAHDAKDAAAMTDDEIRQCLRNAISHYEYLDWVA